MTSEVGNQFGTICICQVHDRSRKITNTCMSENCTLVVNSP